MWVGGWAVWSLSRCFYLGSRVLMCGHNRIMKWADHWGSGDLRIFFFLVGEPLITGYVPWARHSLWAPGSSPIKWKFGCLPNSVIRCFIPVVLELCIRTSNISTSHELLRNANPLWPSESNSGVGSAICINKSYRWSWCMLKMRTSV